MSFVDGQPRSATITATAPLTIVSLSRQAFQGLSASDPSVALKLMSRLAHIISMRLRNADKFVVEAKSMMSSAPPAPPPPPPPSRPEPPRGGRVILPGGRVLDESTIPQTFQEVEKLPEISNRAPGGLQASDIKSSPDILHKGDPQKKEPPPV
jgi:hypothetical protein